MKRVIKSALLGTFATDGTLLLLGIATGSFAARLLLPEGRGALAAVLLWPNLLAGIGLLSLNEASTYRVGRQPDRVSVVTASAVWLALVLAGVTMMAGYLLMPALLGEERAHLVTITRTYLLIFTPFNFLALALLATDQGALHFGRYNVLRLLVPMIYLIGLVALWLTGSVSVAWVVAVNCGATVVVALIRVILSAGSIVTKPAWREGMELLRLASRMHFATVLLFLTAQADQLVVLIVWNDATLGQYVVALTIASAGLAVVSGALPKVLFPYLAHIRDPLEQSRLLGRGVRHATLVLVGISLPIALLMPLLVPLLFGPAFRDAIGPARLLLIAYLFIALKTILIQSLRGLGETRAGAVAAGTSLGLFMIFVWPLGDSLELLGVAIALIVANVGALGYLMHHLYKRHGLGFHDLWGLNLRTMGEIWTSLSHFTLSARNTND